MLGPACSFSKHNLLRDGIRERATFTFLRLTPWQGLRGTLFAVGALVTLRFPTAFAALALAGAFRFPVTGEATRDPILREGWVLRGAISSEFPTVLGVVITRGRLAFDFKRVCRDD